MPPKSSGKWHDKMGTKTQLEIDGLKVDVSNLDKVLYPKTGFTKGQVIDYYIKIAPYLLPHLKNRPITLKRYPDGVDGFFFYEKQCPPYRPKWIKTADVPRQRGGTVHYCVIDTLPALVWAANLADLELHTFLHKAPALNKPTTLAFDLDPGAPADIRTCCQVAIWLRDLFKSFKLECFPKTSGSKGLQMFVPINTPTNYDRTKAFAHSVAESLAQEFPKKVVSNMRKDLRGGKVLIDWSQNDDHKTTVSVYSLRAKEQPSVSTPLLWDEVESAIKSKSANGLRFSPEDAGSRAKEHGDLFAPVLTLKQKLPVLK